MARVILSIEGDAAKAVAALQKVNVKLQQQLTKTKSLNKASVQMERASVRASAQQRRTATGATRGLGGGVLGGAIGGFSGAALFGLMSGEIRKAFSFMRDEIQQAGQLLRTTQPGQQGALQLSDTLPGFQARIARARGLSRFGIRAADALKLGFEAESLGVLKALEQFAVAGQIAAPISFLQTSSKFGKAFPEGEVGTPLEIVNELIAGALKAAVNIQRLGPTTIRNAPGQVLIGGSAEELLAATAVLTGIFKSEEQAATGLGAVLRVFFKENLGGRQGILKGLDAFDRLSKKEQDKLLAADSEFAKGLINLRLNRAEVEETFEVIQTARADTGTSRSPLRRRLAIAQEDEELRLFFQAKQARAQSEVTSAEIERGKRDLRQDIFIDRLKIAEDALGRGAFRRFLNQDVLVPTAFFFGFDPDPETQDPRVSLSRQHPTRYQFPEQQRDRDRNTEALNRLSDALEGANAAPVLEP